MPPGTATRSPWSTAGRVPGWKPPSPTAGRSPRATPSPGPTPARRSQILNWLARADAPLLFRLRMDPAQWAWGLRFLYECSEARTRAQHRPDRRPEPLQPRRPAAAARRHRHCLRPPRRAASSTTTRERREFDQACGSAEAHALPRTGPRHQDGGRGHRDRARAGRGARAHRRRDLHAVRRVRGRPPVHAQPGRPGGGEGRGTSGSATRSAVRERARRGSRASW